MKENLCEQEKTQDPEPNNTTYTKEWIIDKNKQTNKQKTNTAEIKQGLYL